MFNIVRVLAWLGFCRQKPVSATHKVSTGLNRQKLGLNQQKLLSVHWINFSGMSFATCIKFHVKSKIHINSTLL